MRKQSGAPERSIVIHRDHPKGWDTSLKQSFPGFQVIDIWWCCPNVSFAHMSRIVHQFTKS